MSLSSRNPWNLAEKDEINQSIENYFERDLHGGIYFNIKNSNTD